MWNLVVKCASHQPYLVGLLEFSSYFCLQVAVFKHLGVHFSSVYLTRPHGAFPIGRIYHLSNTRLENSFCGVLILVGSCLV